jgi:isopentenyl phosphate kinase
LVVIKLGGSALTDKRRIYTPRFAMIHAAAAQVARITRRCSVIIVHGAGSFGHMPVRRYGLQDGLKNRGQLKGLTATKLRLLQWESTIDEIFRSHRIPIIPFSTSDFAVTRNGRITTFELEPLTMWLRLGCVPSIGGDIVPDTRKGFAILSGDQIAAYIAIKLNAAKLVYCLDVDGLYDANPIVNSKARLVKSLTVESALGLASKSTRTFAPDVTGGIVGKVREAIVAAKKRVPVYFVNLTKDERLLKVTLGQETICSTLSI